MICVGQKTYYCTIQQEGDYMATAIAGGRYFIPTADDIKVGKWLDADGNDLDLNVQSNLLEEELQALLGRKAQLDEKKSKKETAKASG